MDNEQGKYVGSCLCGAIEYEVEKPFLFFKYCHCSRCRKITGSAFSPNIMVKAPQFRWSKGKDCVKRFEPETAKLFSSGFCPTCGSNMPWYSRNERYVIIPAGTLDKDPEYAPQKNIFWNSRAPWFTDACDLEKFAEDG
ncbi:MAG: GFA family protein [Gammaproteobacteria bacterium]|nr:MAG: GFA family protein [Gammaproteobacteria bacterium]